MTDTAPLDDFGGVGISNCPNCLTPLAVAGDDYGPYL
jgi:hypothetical protein